MTRRPWLAFELSADDLVADLYAGKNIVAHKGRAAEYQFGGILEGTLECVKLLAATYTLIQQIRDGLAHMKRAESHSPLAKQWEDELVLAGIPKEKAGSIVRKFTAELADLVKG